MGSGSQAQEGLSQAEKNKRCISRETLEGQVGHVHYYSTNFTLPLNVVMSMVEMIPFLLKVKGVKYVLTEKFCQDPLEVSLGNKECMEELMTTLLLLPS